ncbi:unnamed protein product [Durusdinium trenchii]|uniref:Uncharacterized protein n=1 Tax=Durusdinium trenchii TaxID=1381693 RepID=A0ABP0JP08_9DINO
MYLLRHRRKGRPQSLFRLLPPHHKAVEGSRRPCLQASRGTPEWQPWWPFEEAVTWCWALVIWWLRRSGRSAAGKKYRTDRQDVENFNDRYNLLSYAMMASDNKKYRSFQRAIQQSIEHWASLGEDTVVLEIGCGAYAPFARLCADEGAKQVYAVEGNTWAAERAARKVPANVQVFAGLSQQLPSEKLAPRPNVVVMETIGDWAANEFMVSTFLDASRRLCRPDTKWIPGQVRTCYVPVETPTWGCEIPPGLWLLGSDDQRSRLALSDVATLEFYDFNNFREEPMLLQERQANFTMNRSGELQGFLIWVEVLPFGDEHECLSSLKDVDISWSAMLLALPETLTVVKGDRFPCKTNVQPDTVDGPLLHLEMPWTNKQFPICRCCSFSGASKQGQNGYCLKDRRYFLPTSLRIY